MTNILNPPNEDDLAKQRQIPRIGKEGSATNDPNFKSLRGEGSTPPSPTPEPVVSQQTPQTSTPIQPSNAAPVLPEQELSDTPIPPEAPLVQGQPLGGGELGEDAQLPYMMHVPPSGRPLPQGMQHQKRHPEGLTDQDLLANNGGLGQLNARQPSPFTWSPIETPIPNLNSLAAMQEATSDYNRGVANYESNMEATSAQNIIRSFQLLNPQPIQHAGVYEVDTVKLRDELASNREASIRYIRENRPGIQDAHEDGTGGEIRSGVSATENALTGNGLQSNAGKRKQDQDDPNREKTGTQGGFWNWLKGAAGQAAEAAADVVTWVGEGLMVNPGDLATPKGREHIKKIQEQGHREWEDDNTGGKFVESLAPVRSNNKQVFNPAKGQYGDYGSNALISPVLYGASLAQSQLMAGVLEVTDAIGATKKPSHDQRSRSLQALQGVDNSFSASKSDYAPLSLQQPENAPGWQKAAGFVAGLALDIVTGGVADAVVGGLVKAGSRTVIRTTTTRTAQEVAEEAAEKATREAQQQAAREAQQIAGQKADEAANAKAANQVARDTDTGVIPNKPASHKDPIIRHNVENNRVSDPTVRVNPNTVEVRSPHRTPEALRHPSSNGWISTTIKTKPIDPGSIRNPLQVNPIKLQDLPSGTRLSDRITPAALNQKPLTDADLTLIRRSNEQISTLARNTINPETGKPFLNSGRTLSDAEVALLNDKYGNLFDRYGQTVPDLDNATLLDTPDGLYEIIGRTDLKETKLNYPSIKQIEGLTSQLDEISKKMNRAFEKGIDDPTPFIKQYENLSEKLIRSIQDQPGLYDMYVRRGDIPKSLSVTSREGMMLGDELVQTDLALQAQRPVLDQLIDEVDATKLHLDNTETELNALRTVGRGDIYNALTTKATMGEDVPELRISEYVPKMIPSLEELPTRPAGVHKVLDDNPLWLHGSDSPIGIRERDILNGATPSEHGLGIYLTKDQDVADQAASALAQSNRPPRPDSQPTVPHRITVTTDKLIAPLNLNSVPSAKVRSVFNDAANSVGLPGNFADKVNTTSKLWDEFKVKYHEQIGQVPESINREFQQKVLIGLQKAGYDSGTYVDAAGNTHLVVYQPHKLGVNGSPVTLDTPSINKQVEARAWLDHYTFTSNPSEVNHVNSVRSRMQHQTQILHEQAEALATERFKQLELIENKINLQDQMERLKYENTEQLLRADVEAAPPLDIQKTLRDNNNPCL